MEDVPIRRPCETAFAVLVVAVVTAAAASRFIAEEFDVNADAVEVAQDLQNKKKWVLTLGIQ